MILKKYTWWWETLIPLLILTKQLPWPSADLVLVAEWTGQPGAWRMELTVLSRKGESSSSRLNPADGLQGARRRAGSVGPSLIQTPEAAAPFTSYMCYMGHMYRVLPHSENHFTSWHDPEMNTVTNHFWFFRVRIFCLSLLDYFSYLVILAITTKTSSRGQDGKETGQWTQAEHCGPKDEGYRVYKANIDREAGLGDGGCHHPMVHRVTALKYVHSFEKMLYKGMATVEEHLLFTGSDQNFLMTSSCLGNHKLMSHWRQR